MQSLPLRKKTEGKVRSQVVKKTPTGKYGAQWSESLLVAVVDEASCLEPETLALPFYKGKPVDGASEEKIGRKQTGVLARAIRFSVSVGVMTIGCIV